MAGLLDFFQGASNAAASNISAPVDGLAWLLKKAGMDIQNPIGGSDWMESKGLTKKPENKWAGLLGEGVGGLTPILAAAKAAQIAKLALKGADNLAAPRTLNPQTGAVFVYPQDKALATAQLNAAKSLDEGGLGLLANNTPAQRAQAMGFTDDAFHGTTAKVNYRQMKAGEGGVDELGKGIYTTDTPSGSGWWAKGEKGRILPLNVRSGEVFDASTLKDSGQFIGGKKTRDEVFTDIAGRIKADPSRLPNIIKDWANEPVADLAAHIKNSGARTGDYNSWIKAAGFDSARDKTSQIAGQQATFDAANIRSRFAAFDPARRNEADILGKADPELLKLIAGAGLLGYGGYSALKD